MRLINTSRGGLLQCFILFAVNLVKTFILIQKGYIERSRISGKKQLVRYTHGGDSSWSRSEEGLDETFFDKGNGRGETQLEVTRNV